MHALHLTGVKSCKKKFTNFDYCRDKSGEQKLRGWTSAIPRQAPTPTHTRRPKCPGDAPRLARAGVRYSLVPNAINSEWGTIRATAAVSSPFFMHEPQMLYPSVFRVLFNVTESLKVGFVVFYHGMRRTLDTLLICMLFFCLFTRNTSFLLFVIFRDFDEAGPVMLFARCKCPSIFPLRDCCSRLRRRNNVDHQRCLTPIYSAITVFDALLIAASNNVMDFAAALTGAAVTGNFLELANNTFFLGDSTLRSKLFIRLCYKELSEIILSGASSGTLRKIVVTGTPGISKSVFVFFFCTCLAAKGKLLCLNGRAPGIGSVTKEWPKDASPLFKTLVISPIQTVST